MCFAKLESCSSQGCAATVNTQVANSDDRNMSCIGHHFVVRYHYAIYNATEVDIMSLELRSALALYDAALSVRSCLKTKNNNVTTDRFEDELCKSSEREGSLLFSKTYVHSASVLVV